MSTEENKALARHLYDEAWNKGNTDVIDQFLAPNFVGHDADNGLLPAEGEGREGIKRQLLAYRSAFPDVHLTIEDQIAEGDKVVSRWVATGTQAGALGRVPPTGKYSSVTGVFIDRFSNGKVVESWSNFDALGMLLQLGILPVPHA
jgi:steroid delta-isomerase-like uncharacterized protein